MKKRILLTVLCTVCLLCSCGETRMTGDVPDTGNINTADIIGSTEEIPYEDIIKKEMFAMCFDNYTTGSDPLQLVGGTFSDAAVAKPLKPVLVEGGSVKAVLNVWEFPVVHDGDYIGFINCDMRNLRNGEPSFFGGESFAPKLNEALKKGDIALFDTANGTYGIYADNTVIALEADRPYDGALTFEQADKGCNLITSDSAREIIYKNDA